jgi:hypothetical protein
VKRFSPLSLAALALVAGCATFDGPPDVSIVGDALGQLADAKAPLVLAFSKPPRPETVKIKVARYVTSDEGLLPDEETPPRPLDLLYGYDPVQGQTGGVGTLAKDGSTFTIQPTKAPPTGAPLVLLLEPGLADAAGVATVDRRRTVFTYLSPLMCSAPVTVVKAGTYFTIAVITSPIMTHVHLWLVLDIDPLTGKFTGRFTKGKRNPDPNRCPTPCGTGLVCRLLPTPACVTPSDPAGSVDEYPDYVVDTDPITGFNFTAEGCSVDQAGGSASFSTLPVDIVVNSPKVTLHDTTIAASLTADAMGTLRGMGSLVADQVLLGIIDSGMGQGDMTMRSIPDADAPADLSGP